MDIEEVVIEESYYERRVVDGSGGKEAQGATAFEESLDWDAEDEDDAYLDGWDDDFESDDVCEDLSELYESSHNKALGKRGERAAARYLERMNYIVLERNWKCPFGEADIIALDESTLVFVEVKTRTSIAKGFPSEAVDARKRARYEKIAAWYLKDYGECDIPVRFDVIALMVVSPDRAFMKHYVNAFGVEG